MSSMKMLVMIPVMLAARKLDGEDPQTIFLLRCAYFAIQGIIMLLMAYIYMKASSLSSSKDGQKIVYVPPPPQPFADPNAPKKYTQSTYGAHVLATSRTLLGSTFFGFAITTGLHFYKGMLVGLAIQSVMGPLNFIENPLLKLFFLGKTDNVFGEKTREELEPDAEVVDEMGNPVEIKRQINAEKSTSAEKVANVSVKTDDEKKSLEDIILDTWDDGEKANLSPLLQALNNSNINYQTKTDDNGWTALMIVSGLGNGVTGVSNALKKMKALGADATIVDNEGWSALHWTAFHGSAEAAKVVLTSAEEGGLDGVNLGLHLVRDKEGKTPLDHAIAEKNDDVAKVIEDATEKEQKLLSDGEGVRRRKQ